MKNTVKSLAIKSYQVTYSMFKPGQGTFDLEVVVQDRTEEMAANQVKLIEQPNIEGGYEIKIIHVEEI